MKHIRIMVIASALVAVVVPVCGSYEGKLYVTRMRQDPVTGLTISQRVYFPVYGDQGTLKSYYRVFRDYNKDELQLIYDLFEYYNGQVVLDLGSPVPEDLDVQLLLVNIETMFNRGNPVKLPIKKIHVFSVEAK